MQQTNQRSHKRHQRAAFQFTETYSEAGSEQPYNYPKRDRSNKRNRHYKYLLPVILIGFSHLNPLQKLLVASLLPLLLLLIVVAASQTVQVLQGPYITNTYGGGIQCQGPTRNFTPFVTGNVSASKPFEDYYDSFVYDMSDNTGASMMKGIQLEMAF